MATSEMDSKLIGERLAVLRGKKTRESVCKDLGISKSALSMYENGERIPRDPIKMRLAIYYGTTVQKIFFAD